MSNKYPDEGVKETEEVLETLEARINKEYKQAEAEISEKLDEYLRKFEVKDSLKKQAVANGQITQEEYEEWRMGQIAVGERWEEMKTTIAEDLTNTAEIAKSITYDTMPEVYSINHNYGTYQVESISNVNTSYTLYDASTVERLFDDEDTLYHKAGTKVTANINAGKQMAWDKKQIQSVMTQSLLQGESIGKIATRLSKTVGESDRKAAIRNARTMTTGVQNAGRVDSYKRAEKMGINLQQEWVAALDNRTRHEHRILDGQRVDVGEKFKVAGYEIAYPADPTAEAFLVYNCRCTLIAALKGHEIDSSWKQDVDIEGQTYDEWKNSHVTRSDSITKQDEIESTMINYYNNQYRSYAKNRKISSYVSSRNTSTGKPSAVYHYNTELNTRQKKLLNNLTEYDSNYIVKKSEVSMTDLSALTAATGDEFALFTKSGQRMIIRGNSTTVNVTEEYATELYNEGYKFSGHTHSTVGDLIASDGDYTILKAFHMTRSVIYDPTGKYNTFELIEED